MLNVAFLDMARLFGGGSSPSLSSKLSSSESSSLPSTLQMPTWTLLRRVASRLTAWLVLVEQVPREQHHVYPMHPRQQQHLLECCEGITNAYRIPLASRGTTTSTSSSEDMIWWMTSETAADGGGNGGGKGGGDGGGPRGGGLLILWSNDKILIPTYFL
jgi:hypothetical protein